MLYCSVSSFGEWCNVTFKFTYYISVQNCTNRQSESRRLKQNNPNDDDWDKCSRITEATKQRHLLIHKYTLLLMLIIMCLKDVSSKSEVIIKLELSQYYNYDGTAYHRLRSDDIQWLRLNVGQGHLNHRKEKVRSLTVLRITNEHFRKIH